jgi:bla regulator protein BlaR1
VITTSLWTSGWPTAFVNHLWQSTAIVFVAWLLTLALQNNSARVRHAIWLLASLKFLLPFQLLSYVGARLSKPLPTDGAQFYAVVEEFTRPIRQAPIQAAPTVAEASSFHAANVVWMLLGIVWFCGFAVFLMKWISGWRSASRMVANAELITLGREFDALSHVQSRARVRVPVRLLLSPAGMEPGVFGIIRPVLLWPVGLSERLDHTQIEAIVAHEIEHVRRRDNLSCAVHAFVESIFWFHPLVRWMSTRLSEERERACDESVLHQNSRREAYAESILKVCAFCVEPAAACVSGVSGADLKQRILRIMTHRSGMALSFGRKCLLSLAAVTVIAAPIGFGVLHGQSASAGPSADESASTANLPKYDVVSIKPVAADDGRLMIMFRPSGVELKGIPVQMLLQQAFGVEKDRIVGAPDWVRSRHFDFEAKVTADDAAKMQKLKMQQRNAMMLPVLEDRFHLKYHHETRELPMYALVIAKGGPKLTESKPGDHMGDLEGRPRTPEAPLPPPGSPAANAKPDGAPPRTNRPAIGEGMRMTPGNFVARGGTIDFLRGALSNMLGRTVVDKTGLTGKYDYTLNWTPDEGMRPPIGGAAPGGEPPADAGGPTLFTALQEQLGLKLESQKGKVDVIVIDHIDPPTEN